jgi:hypothetical protein
MRYFKQLFGLYTKLILLIGFFVLSFMLTTHTIQAQTFNPPDQAVVNMYSLTTSGYQSGGQCIPLNNIEGPDFRYGCTSDPNRPYPFSASTVSIQIDGPAITDTNNDGRYVDNNFYDPAQRYLWDVVATEYGIHQGSQGNKPLAGIKAQAIAARTYLFQRIHDGYSINNSNAFHVFVPYSYEVLLPEEAQRERLLAALQERAYLTPPNSTLPITAFYGADNRDYTTDGRPEGSTANAQNYLQQVWDPISAEFGCQGGTNADCGTGFGGMSSKGAARWSFGHTSSIGPAGVGENQCPDLAANQPDRNGDGKCWSVRWDNAYQILTHYYSYTHVRDANDPNRILTPTWRWAPLALSMPSTSCLNQALPVDISIQNTSLQDWQDGLEVQLRYSIVYLGDVGASSTDDMEGENEQMQLVTSAAPSLVGVGKLLRIPFLLDLAGFNNGQGRYRIRYDLYFNGQSFASLAETEGKTWPSLAREINLYSCAHTIFAPLVQRSPNVTESSH